MAYTAGNIGDQSETGTGLAFVLPESKTTKYAMQLAQTHAEQLQTLARAKQAQALKLQQQYQEDFKNQKLPKAFAPFDKALADRHNKWLADGAKMWAETGKNPYNDAKFMARHNDEVMVPASKSNELGQNYTKLRAIAETDPNNKYTKESKQAVIDYEKYITDHPFDALDKPLPQLVETPASLNDLVKTLKATSTKIDDGRWETKGPDSSNHKAQAFAAIMGDDKWHPLMKKYGYNPDLPDFGVYTDPKHENGKRVWYTNSEFLKHQAKEILDNPTDPKNQRILQTLGIDPDKDQYADEKLKHAIADQNAAMGRLVSDIAAKKDAEVPTERQRKFGQERLELAERNFELSEERLKFQREKQDAKTFYARNLSDRILSGEDGSGEELSSFYQGNPNYGKPLEISPMKDGKRTITVPAKMKANPNYNPILKEGPTNPKMIESQKPYKVDLDFNRPYEAKAKLASVMHNVGINVNPDKYMQPNPHKNEDTKSSPTTYDPKLPFKSFNGRTLTHKQLIDAGYSEERIKKYIEEGKLKQ